MRQKYAKPTCQTEVRSRHLAYVARRRRVLTQPCDLQPDFISSWKKKCNFCADVNVRYVGFFLGYIHILFAKYRHVFPLHFWWIFLTFDFKTAGRVYSCKIILLCIWVTIFMVCIIFSGKKQPCYIWNVLILNLFELLEFSLQLKFVQEFD